MNLSCRLPLVTAMICLITATMGTQRRSTLAQTPAPTKPSCPPAVLSRLTRHKIAAGETLESIAKRYKLMPETIIALNLILKARSLPVGQEILIPPINGIRVQVPAGSRWEDVAVTYGVRTDVLYELNGCQPKPRQVFIPGVSGSATQRRTGESYTGFQGYPLPITTSVALSYGWHEDLKTGHPRFHSGIDLLASPGTPVLSVEAGTIAYAGEQGGYGNLVVVNHQGGRQTRYAHLNEVLVTTGQSVKVGAKLGTVGSTGRPDITPSHLHFEVRYYSSQGWIAQDPEPNLKAKPTAQR